jgi:hypothetical protein
MSADRWLNYSNAAALLGMTPESLRQRARREHWRKQMSNEGKALVLVPIDAARNTAGDAPPDAPGDAAVVRPVTRPKSDPVAAYLARIKELEARADELRRELDQARSEREDERRERLAERERADKLTIELVELAKRFSISADDANTRQAAVEAKLDMIREQMAAIRHRPWWQRLAG